MDEVCSRSPIVGNLRVKRHGSQKKKLRCWMINTHQWIHWNIYWWADIDWFPTRSMCWKASIDWHRNVANSREETRRSECRRRHSYSSAHSSPDILGRTQVRRTDWRRKMIGRRYAPTAACCSYWVSPPSHLLIRTQTHTSLLDIVCVVMFSAECPVAVFLLCLRFTYYVIGMLPPPLKNDTGGILYSGLSVCEWVSLWVRVCASRKPCDAHYFAHTADDGGAVRCFAK